METRPPHTLPPGSSQVLLLLTQVNHERNKSPADSKLAALKKLLQPLLGLLAQLHHSDGRGGAARTLNNRQQRRESE